MPNIDQIKQCILLCKAATTVDKSITPMIYGHRGIGKSESVKQLCVERGWGMIDFRASQIEASDLRGMPAEDKENNRTVFRPPSDMPIADLSNETIKKMLEQYEDPDRRYLEDAKLQPRYEHGILFLDEINRAQDDVQQAAFQLILDRRIGQFTLPPGWIIVCAGNFMEGSSYQTNSFTDAAFISRFCHLIMSSDTESAQSWATYISNRYANHNTSVHSDVIETVFQNMRILDGDLKGDLGFSITPSRRGWEMVIRVMIAAEREGFSDEIVDFVASGLVGPEAARMIRSTRLPVKPLELIKNGVKRYEAKIKSMKRDQIAGLTWGLVTMAKPHLDKKEYYEACGDYMKILCRADDRDIIPAMARALYEANDKNTQMNGLRAATISNPHLAKILAKNTSNDPNDKGRFFMDYVNKDAELSQLLKSVSWGTND